MASSFIAYSPERPKIEQIVVEFFAKSLHIILESRIPALSGKNDHLGSSASSSISGPKTRDRWFNLALGDCTSTLENFEPWRWSFSDPMVVDILLDRSKFVEKKPAGQKVGTSDRLHWAEGVSNMPGGSPISANKATVLERWTVQFEQRKRSFVLGSSSGSTGASGARLGPGVEVTCEGMAGLWQAQAAGVNEKEEWSESGSGSRSQRTRINESAVREGLLPARVTEVSAVYKRTVVMLRTLYSRCRLLPAYRMFRILSSPKNCCDFSLSYRVLSTAAPLSKHESQDMTVYSFMPVETAFGRMCMSVEYRLTTTVIALEVLPSISAHIIPDYVGSPTTDPLKRFTGEPHSLPTSGTFTGQGVRVVSVPSSLQSSPGLGLGRRHSWSGTINQIQPALQPPSSPSYGMSRSPLPSTPIRPSPPHLPSPYPPFPQKQPSSNLSFSPYSSPLSLAVRHSGIPTKVSQPISIDNCRSPSSSPSPSPSPPTVFRGSNPVNIPRPSQLRGSKLSVGDTHQLSSSRNLLPPLSQSAKKSGVLLKGSSENPRYSGQLLSHAQQQSRSLESTSHLHNCDGQQVSLNEGTESLLYGQSQTTLSRSSSKTTLGEDSEEDDCLFPFADVEADERQSSRTEGFGRITGETRELLAGAGSLQHRAPDATVSALIQTLNSAAPLRHSKFSSVETLDASRLMVIANEREFMYRVPPSSLGPTGKMMAGEGLEELQIYRIMRDRIQRH